jgi:diguanylate cyclase (GGDEF)-like protein
VRLQPGTGLASDADLKTVMPRKAIFGLSAFLLVYLSWQAFRWLPDYSSEVGNSFFLPIGAAAVYCCWRASRRCVEVASLRRFWLLMAAAIACQLVGDTVMVGYDVAGLTEPFPSIADVAYLALYPVMLLALLNVPVAPVSRHQQVRVMLDLTIVVVSGAMVIWYLSLQQIVLGGGQSFAVLATSAAYPLGDMILVGGIGIALLRWSPATLQRPLRLITVALTLFVVADVSYSHSLLTGGYTAGGAIDALWIAALALFTVAGASQQTAKAGTTETDLPPRDEVERRVSLLPAAALVVSFAIIFSAEWRDRFVSDMSLIVVAAVLGALVATRLYVTQNYVIQLKRDLSQAHTDLAYLADRDQLTATVNRRATGETLVSEIERARRYGRGLSVLFLDIDHFKSINDDLGHSNGDRALTEICSVISSCLRPADTLGRWGGEEFLVLLPETGTDAAARVGERIRAEIETHTFLVDDGRVLTCSIGAANYPSQAADADSLIDRADSAMYQAKRLGRNRVAIAV